MASAHGRSSRQNHTSPTPSEGVIEVNVLVGDLAELARHIDPENQTESVRRYRETLGRLRA